MIQNSYFESYAGQLFWISKRRYANLTLNIWPKHFRYERGVNPIRYQENIQVNSKLWILENLINVSFHNNSLFYRNQPCSVAIIQLLQEKKLLQNKKEKSTYGNRTVYLMRRSARFHQSTWRTWQQICTPSCYTYGAPRRELR
jgi:hypothetical protein